MSSPRGTAADRHERSSRAAGRRRLLRRTSGRALPAEHALRARRNQESPSAAPRDPEKSYVRMHAESKAHRDPAAVAASRLDKSATAGRGSLRPERWHADPVVSRCSKRKSSSSWNFDVLGIAPKPLEVVILPRSRREAMDQQVAVIGQDPLGLRVALHAERHLAMFFKIQPDLVGDRLDLTGVRSRTDYEIVGKRGDAC